MQPMKPEDAKHWLEANEIIGSTTKGGTTVYNLGDGSVLVIDNQTGSGWQFV